MERELDTYGPSDIAPSDTPEARWKAWAMWAAISLAMVLFAVLVMRADTGLLLGWAVGIIVPAALMVFGRK